MGAISERLNAVMILSISCRCASFLFFFSYLVYYSRQLARILKSSIFSLILKLISTEDCFLLVAVELPFLWLS